MENYLISPNSGEKGGSEGGEAAEGSQTTKGKFLP